MTLVKLQDTKLIHKHLTFLYTNNRRSETEINETISFTTATKEIKYQGRNHIQGGKLSILRKL